MKLTIDITDEMYQAVKNGTWCGNELWYNALKNGIPQETVTEFADRCRECGARYGRLLNQKWIPVSERLPEDEQEILFSTKTGRVQVGKYHDDDSANQWYSYRDKCRAWNNVVTAWMPLPEPYKAEGRNSE